MKNNSLFVMIALCVATPAITYAESWRDYSLGQPEKPKQTMRQVVIGRGATAWEADQDAVSQAQSISGGRHRIVSRETNYRPNTKSFECRMVIEF